MARPARASLRDSQPAMTHNDEESWDDNEQATPGSASGTAGGPPSEVSQAQLAAEVAELKEGLASVTAEAEEHLAAWQRARADYENLKRRSAQEVQDRTAQATSALLLDLLPIVDDFERALAADPSEATAWQEGIGLIDRELCQLLERIGLQPIAAEGQPFDPNFHEAVSQAPGPTGEVITQMRKGYLLGTRVLRPALVVVGQEETTAETNETESS